MEEAIREMDKAIVCLALELPECIHEDVEQRWEAVKVALKKGEHNAVKPSGSSEPKGSSGGAT
jgi:hypothetical protein